MKSIRLSYLRMAKEMILVYHDDAVVNGLKYFRHEEAAAIEAFSKALDAASQDYREQHYEPPQIPNWNRVFAAIPNFAEQLVEAVEADNAV